MFLLYPLEIAGLSLINSEESLPNKELLNYNNYLQWIIINWIGTDNDYNILNEIENENTNTFIIILSWVLSFFLYNISYLIITKIKYKKICKVSYLNYILKYLIVNYFSLFLWNFNSILNINKTLFYISFINLILFNFITFWTPGILFDFIYGEKLYYYRQRFSFLIDEYNPKYKYFTISLIFLKILTFAYLMTFKYYPKESKFILYLYLLIYYYIKNNIKIFNNYKNDILVLLILSFLIISLSITENYINNNIYFFIIKIFLFLIFIISIIYLKKNNFYTNDYIQMEKINF